MNNGDSYHIAKLVIKESSLTLDKVVRDGKNRTTYTAVKNSPFTIKIGLDTSTIYDSVTMQVVPGVVAPTLNLTHVALDARLLYDNAEEKEVDFVKHKPMEFKIAMNETGDEATAECRLKVLTSQLEDMFFRIKFRALQPVTKSEISNLLIATTCPIKVISKPERQTKKPRPVGKKPSTNDTLLETLSRVSEKQQQQHEVLQKLLHSIQSGALLPSLPLSSMSTPLPLTSSTVNAGIGMDLTSSTSDFSSMLDFGEPPKKKLKLDDEKNIDFDATFRDLLYYFGNLTTTQRFDNIKNFVQQTSCSNELSELHDILCESLGRQPTDFQANSFLTANVPSAFNSNVQECYCANCPHKDEYMSVASFVNELINQSNL